jgi:hypothetical protein
LVLNYCSTLGGYMGDPPCPLCPKPDIVEAEPWFGVAGQDLARYRDFSAYVSLRIEDGRARVKRLFIWPHVNYEVVMAETLRFHQLDRVRRFAVDITQDSKVGEDYTSRARCQVEPVRFTAPMKNDMVEYYRDLGQKRLLILSSRGPFVQELRAELAEQERIQGAGEVPKYDQPVGRHDDLFWSLMLAAWASSPYLTVKRWAMRVS